jgi:hypothetical protein
MGIIIKITEISLEWPGGNGNLIEAKLGTSSIYDIPVPPPNAILSSWTGGQGARKINDGVSKTLTFIFDSTAASSSYDISITFDNGCTVSNSN